MTDELLAVRAIIRFVLCSLSKLWNLYTFDLLLAYALRRIREEWFTLVIIFVSRRFFNCSRVASALPKTVTILEG